MKFLIVINLFSIISTFHVFAEWEQITNLPIAFRNNYYLDVYILPTNPDKVWICGRSGAVIRTSNGGQNWETIQIKDQFNPDLQLEKIHFVNDLIGFTSGANKIYKTNDGGATWNDISDDRSTAIWGHWFEDANNGVMVGDGCMGNQQFFRTTNGGLTWNLKEYRLIESGLTHVQMMGSSGLVYAVSSGYLWESVDGGYNWIPKSKSGNNDWQEQLSINGNTILLPFSSGCQGGGFGGGRISLDAGKTWKEVRIQSACFGSFLLTPLNGWLAGTNRIIYHTTDGGNTWVNDYCGIPAGTDLDDIKFYNDSLGYVVGKGVYRYRNYNKLKPQILGNFPVKLCSPDNVVLKTSEKFRFYKWSTGETTETIKVSKSGIYYVTVWNNECEQGLSQKVEVIVNVPQQVSIISDKGNILCDGDTAILNISSDFVKYQWGSGENSKSIKVSQKGKYTCEIIDSNGCTNKAEIDIDFIPNPQINIKKLIRATYCVGDSIFLQANVLDGTLNWYKDNNSNYLGSNSTIWIKDSGKYYADVINSNGCKSGSDTITINFIKDTNKFTIEFLSSEKTVNFGKSINQSVIKKLKINNISEQDFLLKDVLLLKNTSFSVPASQLPVLIPAKSFILLEIIFNPEKIAELKDTLIFEDICNNHEVPLIGEGIPSEYNAKDKCDINIKLITTAYGEDEVISIGKPFPMPAINEIKLPFYSKNKENLDKLNFGIFNIFGNEITFEKSINMISINYYEFTFNFLDLPKGTYFLKINSGIEFKVFPFILN